jgi:hypothetical protein
VFATPRPRKRLLRRLTRALVRCMLAGFPTGPYKLRRKFVAYRLLGVVLCGLAAVGCVILYSSMAWDTASLIRHDQQVWSAGGLELPATIDGEVTTRQFVLNSYDLKVHYKTADGQVRDQPLKFDTLGSMDENQATSVRLAPGSLDDFALSSAVDVSGKRWAAAAFFGGVGIFLLGGAFSVLGFATSKQWRRVHHAARRGSALACQLLAREKVLNQGSDTGAEKLTFRVPAHAGRPPLDVSYQLRTKGSDVVTLDGGTAVLALVAADAPQGAILLLRDFYPLALGENERRQAEHAVAPR